MSKTQKICLWLGLKLLAGFFVLQGLLVFRFVEASWNWAFLNGSLIMLCCVFLSIYLWGYWNLLKGEKQAFRDKYKAINLSNMVIVFDEKGYILEVNSNFCLAMGYKETELIGKHHKMLVGEKVANSLEYIKFWEQLRKGVHIEDDFQRETKNGKEIWIHGTYAPIRSGDGAVYQVIKVAMDITEEKELAHDLLRKNKYLEHAAKILRHDMHSGINTYLPRGIRALKRKLGDDLIKERKLESPIKLIQEGLEHTQRVYRGVYEFTNLVRDNTEIEKESHNLSEILKKYLSQTAYADQVAVDTLPNIEVNAPLFCTAIDNLIRNGLKYNDSDFKMVAITMVDDEHLAVIDNGRGLTQEDFIKLSQPYQRKANQKEAGSGLGLNICVAILNEHGFSVSVGEQQEQGTMIKIKIRTLTPMEQIELL